MLGEYPGPVDRLMSIKGHELAGGSLGQILQHFAIPIKLIFKKHMASRLQEVVELRRKKTSARAEVNNINRRIPPEKRGEALKDIVCQIYPASVTVYDQGAGLFARGGLTAQSFANDVYSRRCILPDDLVEFRCKRVLVNRYPSQRLGGHVAPVAAGPSVDGRKINTGSMDGRA